MSGSEPTGQMTGGSCGPRKSAPVFPDAGVRPVAPTIAAQACGDALATGGVPVSVKTSCLELNAALSGRLNVVWSGLVEPHGYDRTVGSAPM